MTVFFQQNTQQKERELFPDYYQFAKMLGLKFIKTHDQLDLFYFVVILIYSYRTSNNNNNNNNNEHITKLPFHLVVPCRPN
jgi:hypothetical protein